MRTGWWRFLRAMDPARAVSILRRLEFLAGAHCGKGLHVTSRAELILHGREATVVIGDYVTIDGTLECYDHGAISIGNHSFIGRSRFYASRRILVGEYCLISDAVCIMDSDLHPIRASARRRIAESWVQGIFPDVYTDVAGGEVTIGSNVWIGYGCAILKGARIGEGAIVGAGSVVKGDIPPWHVVAGAPARTIRELAANER